MLSSLQHCFTVEIMLLAISEVVIFVC